MNRKVLRVGMILGGKFVEERLFRKPESVFVGTDAKNTFIVPGGNLAQSFELFEAKAGAYTLHFSKELRGKLTLPEGELDLSSEAARKKAQARGAHFALPLPETASGKVSLGEVTLLFQFVAPPPEAPRPELPPAVKGSFLGSMDQLFLLVLGLSLLFHFSGLTLILIQPKPPEQELTLDELPDRFARVMMPRMPEPVKKEAPQAQVAEKREDKADSAKKPGKEQAARADPAAKRAAIQKAVASKGLLKILGSSGTGSGAFEDVLGGGTGTGDIAAALAGAGGVGVATADALGTGGPKGAGSGAVAGIGDLATSGGGKVNLGAKSDVAISGRVQDQAPEVDSSDVDRESLARYVKARTKAIQGCYERELKRNPRLKGKVVVRFTIGRGGRALEVEIEENSLGNEAVASCIRTIIRGWVFPFSPPSDVAVAYPFLFSPAN